MLFTINLLKSSSKNKFESALSTSSTKGQIHSYKDLFWYDDIWKNKEWSKKLIANQYSKNSLLFTFFSVLWRLLWRLLWLSLLWLLWWRSLFCSRKCNSRHSRGNIWNIWNRKVYIPYTSDTYRKSSKETCPLIRPEF